MSTRTGRNIKAPKFFDEKMEEMDKNEKDKKNKKAIKPLKIKLPKLTDANSSNPAAAYPVITQNASPGTAAFDQISRTKKSTAATAPGSSDSSSFARVSEEDSSESSGNRHALAADANSRKLHRSEQRRADKNRAAAREHLSDDDDQHQQASTDAAARAYDTPALPQQQQRNFAGAYNHAANDSAFVAACTTPDDDPFGGVNFSQLMEDQANRNHMQLNYGPSSVDSGANRNHQSYQPQEGRSGAVQGGMAAPQDDFLNHALSWASTSHSTTALPSSSASSTSVHEQLSRRNIVPPPPSYHHHQQREINVAAATQLDSLTPPPPVPSSSTSSTANGVPNTHHHVGAVQQPDDEAAARLEEMTQIIAAESGELINGNSLMPMNSSAADVAGNQLDSIQAGGTSSGDLLINGADSGSVVGGVVSGESGVDHVPTEQELQEALNEVMAEMENSGYDFLNHLSSGSQAMDVILDGAAVTNSQQQIVNEPATMVTSSSQVETVASGVVAPAAAAVTTSATGGAVMGNLMVPHQTAMHQQNMLYMSPSGTSLRHAVPQQHGMNIVPGQFAPHAYVMAPPAHHNMFGGGGVMTSAALNAASSTTSLMDDDGGRLAIDMGDDAAAKAAAGHHQHHHQHNIMDKISTSLNRQIYAQQHHQQQQRGGMVENDGGEAAYQREVEAEREEYENQEGAEFPFDSAADGGGMDGAFGHNGAAAAANKPPTRYSKRGPYNKRKNNASDVTASYMDNSNVMPDINDLSRDGLGDDSYGDYVDDGSGPNLEQLAVMLDTLPDADRIVARMILMDDVPPEQVRMLARQLDSDRLAREMNGEGLLRQQAEEMRAKRRQNINGALMYADAKFEEVQQHNRDTNQTTAQTKIANELKDAYNKLTPDQQAPYELMAQDVRQGMRELPGRVLRNFHYLTGIGMLEHLSNRVYAVDRQHVVKMWRKITKKSRHALAELAHVIEEALDKFLAEEDAVNYQQQQQIQQHSAAPANTQDTAARSFAPQISSGGMAAGAPANSSQELLSEPTPVAQTLTVSNKLDDSGRKAAAALAPKRSTTPQTAPTKKEAAGQGVKGTPAGPTGGATAAAGAKTTPAEKPKPVERPRGVTLLTLDEKVNEQRGYNKLQAVYRDGATGSRDNTMPCSLACGAHFPVAATTAIAGAASNAANSSGVTSTSDDSGIAHMDEVDSEAEFEDTAASQWVTHPFEPHAMPLPANVPLNAAEECKPTALAYAGLLQHVAHRTQQVASMLAIEQQKAFEHLGSSRSYRSRNSTTAAGGNIAKPERKLHIANEHLMDSIINASCSILAGALAQISGNDPNTGAPAMKFMANGRLLKDNNDILQPAATGGTVMEKKTDDESDAADEKELQEQPLTLEQQNDAILASVETVHALMSVEGKPDQLRATRVLAAHREAVRKREALERAQDIVYAAQHGISEQQLHRSGQRIVGGVFGKNNMRNGPYSQFTPGQKAAAGANIIRSGGRLFNSNNKGIVDSSGKRRITDYGAGIGSKRPRYTIGQHDEDSDDYDDYGDDADYKGPRGRRGGRGGSSHLDEEYSTDDEMADNEEETEQQYGTWNRQQNERFASQQKQNATPNNVSGFGGKFQQSSYAAGPPRLRTSFLQNQQRTPADKGRGWILSKTANNDESVDYGGDDEAVQGDAQSRLFPNAAQQKYSGMMSRQRLSTSGQPGIAASRQQFLSRNDHLMEKSQSPQGPGVAFSRTPRTTSLLQRGFLGGPLSFANAAGGGANAVSGAQQRSKLTLDNAADSSTATESGLPAEMITTNDSAALPLPAPVVNVEYMPRPAAALAEPQQMSPTEDQMEDTTFESDEYGGEDAAVNVGKAASAAKVQQKVAAPFLSSDFILYKNQKKKLMPASAPRLVVPSTHQQSVTLSQPAGQQPRLFGKSTVSLLTSASKPVLVNQSTVVKGLPAGMSINKPPQRNSVFGAGLPKPLLSPPERTVSAIAEKAATRAKVFGSVFKPSNQTLTIVQAPAAQRQLVSQTVPAARKSVAFMPSQAKQQQLSQRFEQKKQPVAPRSILKKKNYVEQEYEEEEEEQEYDEYDDDGEYQNEAEDYGNDRFSGNVAPAVDEEEDLDETMEIDEDYAGSDDGQDDDANENAYNDDAASPDDYTNHAPVGAQRTSAQQARNSFGFVLQPPSNAIRSAAKQSRPVHFSRQPAARLPAAVPSLKARIFTQSGGVFTNPRSTSAISHEGRKMPSDFRR